MTNPANVRSLQAIRDFKVALLQFEEQATSALEAITQQINRVLDWLQHDRPGYWKQQLRRGFDKVAETRASLQS